MPKQQKQQKQIKILDKIKLISKKNKTFMIDCK